MSSNIKGRTRSSALDSTAASSSAGPSDAAAPSEFLEVNPAFQEMLVALEGCGANCATMLDFCSFADILEQV